MNNKKHILIEFVGMPGSGKTTLTKNIVNMLYKEDYYVVNATSKQNIIKKHFYAFTFIFRKPIYSFNTLTRLFKTSQDSFNDFRAVFTNWFYKCELFYRCSKKEGLYVFDEGPVHSLYSILYSAKCDLTYKDIFEIFNILPPSNLYFYIKTDQKCIIDRLLSRGKSRLADDIRRCDNYEEQSKLVERASNIYSYLEMLMDNERVIVVHQNKHDAMAVSKDILKQIISQLEFTYK